MGLKDWMEQFVDGTLDKWDYDKVAFEKIINDPIQGAGTFQPYEVHVIDTPFVQRLRGIHQTGMSYLVYPTATHSRFEHSLGVTTLADRFWRSLRSKHGKKLVSDETRAELRLASILHDVGHGPFSHVSEEVYAGLPEITSEIEKIDGKFSKCKPHEVLSYYLITSKRFTDFMKDDILKGYGQDFAMENVANMIIGQMDDPSKDQWKSDIINGAFDSDKLDYMLRDSYFTGVRMEIDLDRVLYTLVIDERQTQNRKIIARLAGVHSLEQVMFNKLLLYSSIYHHHTIRAIECMVKTALELLLDEHFTIKGRCVENAVDFLRLSDSDFLSEQQDSNELRSIARNVRNRTIYKRSAVLCLQTVENRSEFYDLLRLSEDRQSIAKVRSVINYNMGRTRTESRDVWVDLPESPSVREPPMCDVQIAPGTFSDINKLFPLSGWLTAYAENKWRGHVFTFESVRKQAFDAAKTTFKALHGIELNDVSKHLAKNL